MSSRDQRAKWVLGAAAVAVVLAAAALVAGPARAGASVPSTQPRYNHLAVPVTGAYLGIDPHFESSVPMYEQLASFQSTVGRKMALVAVYTAFRTLTPTTTLDRIAAQGSVPLVSWHCGAPDAAVASGAEDAVIKAQAAALKAFGHSVLLRWFWEMNLGNVPAYAACLGPAQTAAAEYVAAFRRVVTIFRQVGATNVSFVWAPSAAVHAPSAVSFYPGSDYVDWIGFDLYNRPGYPLGFAGTFAPTYRTYAAYGKPMAITETGAPQGAVGPGGGSPTQAQWLQQIAASLPVSFPEVHALVYVDASDLANYILSGSGLTEFETLAGSKYFSLQPAA